MRRIFSKPRSPKRRRSGHEALKPGVTVNDRLFSLTDIGKYNVAVAYVRARAEKPLARAR